VISQTRKSTGSSVSGKTRFAQFLASRGIDPRELIEPTGLAKQHIYRILKGANFTLAVLRRIVRGVRLRLNEDIKANHLFDLGDEEPLTK
jgi:predicted transcriptional regulator